MSKVEYSKKCLKIDDRYTVNFSYPIERAFESRNIIVALLDPDSYPAKGMHQNLLGFDKQGNKLWEAELPRHSKFDIWTSKGSASEVSDIYWKVESEDPLVVSSFSSYTCRINEATGKIESAEFYK